MKTSLLFAVSALIALAALPASAQTVSSGRLPTRWDAQVSPTSPLPDYPRPQMTRARWQSLNGSWDYGLTDSTATAPPAAYDGKILVPFPYEAPLSGVAKPSPVTQRLWYRRSFTIPSNWKGQRVMLHFGAVNWDSTVSVNGTPRGEHKGGYTAIDYDITDALKPGQNELVVSAWNPMTDGAPNAQVMGKQRAKPISVLYTGATGIWQSVWLEPVPAAHITGLKITPDVDTKALHLTVDAGGMNSPVKVTVQDGARVVAQGSGAAGTELTLPISESHLWSPDDPHLYGLHVALVGKGGDSVDSYFAMRKISLGKDIQGRACIFLNNKPIFQIGVLDQGYWPDGIYTAPTDDALRFDIETAKQFGFNLIRKHAKVEPDRWYYWTDKLGMLVWQDMPQAFGDGNKFADATKQQWLTEWQREIAQFYNHPSIVVWTPFNEDWGVHDLAQIAALTKQWDPTRLVNSNTGGTDIGVGDLHDLHAYPGPDTPQPEANRAIANGEFGGITMRVPPHMWSTDVFGYGQTLQSSWQVTKRYQELLKRVYALRDSRGASAFVYTQIVDVERESNGLLTYDRAVVKVDPTIITAANKGQFLSLPPDPNPELVPTSVDQPQTWQFTTDKPSDGWFQPNFDASAWKSGPAPFGQGYPIHTDWKTGDIWLRREITLPETIPAKLAVLTIHDEDVEVYLNGIRAASAPGYVSDYVKLPMSDAARAALKPGKNVIAVHCHQTVGGQVIDVGIATAN
ncbi:MAG: glycoside hydrolase family 2 [Armatimonadota bacterium]|nr:glycoside hydrolase family 2 [Armatimonadota bacterium]